MVTVTSFRRPIQPHFLDEAHSAERKREKRSAKPGKMGEKHSTPKIVVYTCMHGAITPSPGKKVVVGTGVPSCKVSSKTRRNRVARQLRRDLALVPQSCVKSELAEVTCAHQ